MHTQLWVTDLPIIIVDMVDKPTGRFLGMRLPGLTDLLALADGSGVNGLSNLSPGSPLVGGSGGSLRPDENAVAEHIIDELSRHSNGEEVNYGEIARDCIRFANGGDLRSKRSDVEKIFEEARPLVFARVGKIEPQEARRILDSQYNKIFAEIDKRLTDIWFFGRKDPTVTRNAPVPNGARFSGTNVNAYKLYPHDLTLNGGIYRSGDIGAAATLYAALKKVYFKTDNPLLTTNFASALGAAGIVADSDLADRSMVLIEPSLRFFAGSEQEIPGWIKFREGVETALMMPLGWNYSIDYMWPVKAGASVGREFSPDSALAVGAEATFYLRNRDVQDMGSIFPNYNDTAVFAAWRSNVVDGRVALEKYYNGTEFEAELSKSFNLFGGIFTTALQGIYSIDTQPVVNPPGVFFTASFDLPKNGWGVSARTSVNATSGEFKDHASSHTSEYAGNLEGDLYAYNNAVFIYADAQSMQCRPTSPSSATGPRF